MPKNILRAMIKKSQAAITPYRQAKTEKASWKKSTPDRCTEAKTPEPCNTQWKGSYLRLTQGAVCYEESLA